jgi:periplasmic protein TonB
MKQQQIATIVSVAVHGGLMAAITGIAASSVLPVNTVTIDFTINRPQTVQPSPQVFQAEPAHTKAVRPLPTKEESFPDTSEETTEEDTAEYAVEETTAPEGKPGQSIAVVPSAPQQDSGQIIEKERQKYLKEQFEYIRQVIYRKASYPSIAIQMNLTGTVFLSFCVREDGGVEMVDIIKSSGTSILDNDAVSTIKRAAPFPRPPIRVVVKFPMEYRLE